jgi:hypothetical protein
MSDCRAVVVLCVDKRDGRQHYSGALPTTYVWDESQLKHLMRPLPNDVRLTETARFSVREGRVAFLNALRPSLLPEHARFDHTKLAWVALEGAEDELVLHPCMAFTCAFSAGMGKPQDWPCDVPDCLSANGTVVTAEGAAFRWFSGRVEFCGQFADTLTVRHPMVLWRMKNGANSEAASGGAAEAQGA